MVNAKAKRARQARLASAMALRDMYVAALAAEGMMLRTTNNDAHWLVHYNGRTIAELWPSTKLWRICGGTTKCYSSLPATVRQLRVAAKRSGEHTSPPGARSRNDGVMWTPLKPDAQLEDLVRLIGAEMFLRFAQEIQATHLGRLWKRVESVVSESPAAR